MPDDEFHFPSRSAPIDPAGPDTSRLAHAHECSQADGSHVAILMGTYNGARFLADQLSSIERQGHRNWTLYASDDGSQDDTIPMLEATRVQWGDGRLHILQGPRRGFVANFLSLACRPDVSADFFAWCDQDDIWREDKLHVALAWLSTIPHDIPALYCGRTETISQVGASEGFSPLFRRPPAFANALVQSIAGGNTMVFNQSARVLLQEAGDLMKLPSHDWWAYQLISGAGGAIYYDAEPKVLYRQHEANIVGSNSGFLARLTRIRQMLEGRLHHWNEQTLPALDSMRHRLTRQSEITLSRFKSARERKLPLRVFGCIRSGIYRQTTLGTLGLFAAIIMKKI